MPLHPPSVSPTSPSPSPWQRGVKEQGTPPPRVRHAIESTWVTETDVALLRDAPLQPSRSWHRRKVAARLQGWQVRLSGALRRVLTLQWVGRAQGMIYLCMALWPLSHMHSFQRFTGPKYDAWSMQSMAGMLAVVGMVLLLTSLRETPSRTTALLGGGMATMLGVLDLAFLAMGQVRSVYWLDVVLETGMALWWIAAYVERRHVSSIDRTLAPRPGRSLYYH